MPIKAGPTKPPRLPIELMSAMPAAAALPPRNCGGSAQNTPTSDRWAIWDSVKLSTRSTMLCCAPTASSSPADDVMAQAATCQPAARPAIGMPSDDRGMAMSAATNGTDVIVLSVKPVAPETSCSSFGSHRKMP